jgi:hypothetical protein
MRTLVALQGNQGLEFLGDAVLKVQLATYFMGQKRLMTVEDLSKDRAKLENNHTLGILAVTGWRISDVMLVKSRNMAELLVNIKQAKGEWEVGSQDLTSPWQSCCLSASLQICLVGFRSKNRSRTSLTLSLALSFSPRQHGYSNHPSSSAYHTLHHFASFQGTCFSLKLKAQHHPNLLPTSRANAFSAARSLVRDLWHGRGRKGHGQIGGPGTPQLWCRLRRGNRRRPVGS